MRSNAVQVGTIIVNTTKNQSSFNVALDTLIYKLDTNKINNKTKGKINKTKGTEILNLFSGINICLLLKKLDFYSKALLTLFLT